MIDVTVPKGGLTSETMEMGQILVEVGQRITPGQPVAEIETDKITVEVEADAGGVVQEILVGQGEAVNIGDVILRLDETA